jgi:hypothetical protein
MSQLVTDAAGPVAKVGNSAGLKFRLKGVIANRAKMNADRLREVTKSVVE